jgi:hypothetical protein
VVNAGPDRSAVLSGGSVSINLAGTISDDGLPQNSVLETFWVATDGPAAVIFTDDADPATTAIFTKAGVYTLELNGTDGERPDRNHRGRTHFERRTGGQRGSGQVRHLGFRYCHGGARRIGDR